MTKMTTMTKRVAGQGMPAKIRVWDPLIRVFHWGLVSAFVVAYLSAEELSTVHEVAGYIVAGLIVFRLIWGVIGSKYARFSQFLRRPATTISYVGDVIQRKEKRYLGHNPAGAVMTVALLVLLSGTALTGWLLEEGAQVSELIKETHEVLANLMLVFIALHLGGVVLSSFRHDENLARAMVTGDKRAPDAGDIA
jgi:cytochrome b